MADKSCPVKCLILLKNEHTGRDNSVAIQDTPMFPLASGNSPQPRNWYETLEMLLRSYLGHQVALIQGQRIWATVPAAMAKKPWHSQHSRAEVIGKIKQREFEVLCQAQQDYLNLEYIIQSDRLSWKRTSWPSAQLRRGTASKKNMQDADVPHADHDSGTNYGGIVP